MAPARAQTNPQVRAYPFNALMIRFKKPGPNRGPKDDRYSRRLLLILSEQNRKVIFYFLRDVRFLSVALS